MFAFAAASASCPVPLDPWLLTWLYCFCFEGRQSSCHFFCMRQSQQQQQQQRQHAAWGNSFWTQCLHLNHSPSLSFAVSLSAVGSQFGSLCCPMRQQWQFLIKLFNFLPPFPALAVIMTARAQRVAAFELLAKFLHFIDGSQLFPFT